MGADTRSDIAHNPAALRGPGKGIRIQLPEPGVENSHLDNFRIHAKD